MTPHPYHLTINETILKHSRLLEDRRPLEDPFIRTALVPRGWKTALAVLLGRYRVSLEIGADPAVVDRVINLVWPGDERKKAAAQPED